LTSLLSPQLKTENATAKTENATRGVLGEKMARIYGRKNCTLVIFLKFSLNGTEIDDVGLLNNLIGPQGARKIFC
jgi:hypothetical protein